MPKATEQQVLALLGERPHTSRELQQALGTSQPTLSRILRQLSPHIIFIDKGKNTRYGRSRPVRDLGTKFPAYRIGEDGNARLFGMLTCVRERYYYWQPPSEAHRLFSHLPWFIQDLRPDGFIGRALAQRYHEELGVPRRLQDWNDDDTLTAAARRGEECIGDLIVGTESLQRYLRAAADTTDIIAATAIAATYPQLAQLALSGNPAGSSAGGEQPKFTVRVENNGTVRHLLVKFSPATATAEGRRWADLLVCEHLALQVIRESGHPAATTSICKFSDRMYLEVERLDRTGLTGRRPLVSLGVVDDEFFGHRDSWIAAADRLEEARMLSAGNAASLRWMSLYGDLIANTDQHFGNVSLVPGNATFTSFTLAPAYDMLPMLYRPREAEMANRAFVPPVPSILSEWHSAVQAAAIFWARAATDTRISDAFRAICEQNRKSITTLSQSPRLIL